MESLIVLYSNLSKKLNMKNQYKLCVIVNVNLGRYDSSIGCFHVIYLQCVRKYDYNII